MRKGIKNRQGPWRSANYFRDRLRGWPSQTPPRSHKMVWGPITVQVTSYLRRDRALQQFSDVLRTGEGFASALILNGRGEPDAINGQVHMSLQSFTQLLQWLFEANPQMFVRPLKNKEGTDEG